MSRSFFLFRKKTTFKGQTFAMKFCIIKEKPILVGKCNLSTTGKHDKVLICR